MQNMKQRVKQTERNYLFQTNHLNTFGKQYAQVFSVCVSNQTNLIQWKYLRFT
jgi:hypothetical protein